MRHFGRDIELFFRLCHHDREPYSHRVAYLKWIQNILLDNFDLKN